MCTTFANVCRRNLLKKNYECARLLLKKKWLRATVFTTSPTIADIAILFVVILATVEVLPIVANSTMSLTMTMTTAPVFHGYDSIADILFGVESAVAIQWVFVEFFRVEECRRILVLDRPSLHVIPLHLEKFVNRHVTQVCRILSFQYKMIFVSISFSP